MDEQQIIDKHFISAKSLVEDSYELAKQVLESGFRPDYLVAVWRGGTPIGAAVHEFFKHFDVEPAHHVIGTYSYDGFNRNEKVGVWGLDFLEKKVNADQSILWVDDIYDTGKSMEAIFKQYEKLARNNTSKDQRIATVYFKDEKNLTDKIPDYFVHKRNDWIVFPHELEGHSSEEIREYKSEKIANLLEDTAVFLKQNSVVEEALERLEKPGERTIRPAHKTPDIYFRRK